MYHRRCVTKRLIGNVIRIECGEKEEVRVLCVTGKTSAISTDWLNTLLCEHLPPIKQVVYLRPYSLRMRDLI